MNKNYIEKASFALHWIIRESFLLPILMKLHTFCAHYHFLFNKSSRPARRARTVQTRFSENIVEFKASSSTKVTQ